MNIAFQGVSGAHPEEALLNFFKTRGDTRHVLIY